MKFYNCEAKGLKLKVRKFLGLSPTFVEVTGEKLVGGLFAPPPPPSWIGLITLGEDMSTVELGYDGLNTNQTSTDYKSLREECPNTEVFFGPYFLVLELNMEIYRVNLRIQFEYRKIRTRKNSVVGHFSRSEWVWDYMWLQVTMGWNKRNSKWLEVIYIHYLDFLLHLLHCYWWAFFYYGTNHFWKVSKSKRHRSYSIIIIN